MLAVADEMALRSLSFSTALQDLASLLHRVGWAQFAPSSVLDEWPEAGDIRRFAETLSPEQVQLFYQIATVGRSELGLAPDEYAGFTMTLDHDRTHALTTPFTPFAFAGEAQVAVALADGPTRDFNLMVRRAQVRGDVQIWHRPTTRMLDPTTVLVFCARGMIDTADGRLHAGDAWRPSPHTVASLTLRDGALALIVRIEPHAA